MIGKKINQLATELAPESTDLTIIGDPISGVSKKITLAQLGAIFSGAVSFYNDLASFPVSGDINVIYCAKDTQKLYLWSGSAYVEVFPSQALLDTYQLRSEKGNANGYASLDSLGKVPISQLPSSIMEYKGTWNAATNTPTLANGTGDTGDVYICNVAGTVNFGAGPITFAVGDYVIYSGTIWQRSSGAVGTVTSVAASITGNSVSISGSPIVTSGTLAFSFAGNATQYVRGDGQLATLPTNGGGGGASVSYYLNGSINQGTIGGVTYYEMNKTPIIGAGTDFTTSSNGYIASFLTDANDPALLNIPAGNFNFETYFEASSGGGSPTFYIELYKYDGTTFTLIASNSTSPKLINDATNIEAYFSALAVPQTTLTLTDRLAIRIYVTTAGRTITLHTENNTLCQVITTFTTGLTALNGLTSQVQYLATGTSGTDFNIASASATHTFNLPTASATNRGALSSADWTTFNNKQNALTNPITGTGTTNYLPKFTSASTIGNSLLQEGTNSIGLGVTPSVWGASNSLDIFNGGSLFSFTNNVGLASNAFFNGTNWLYKNSGVVSTKYETSAAALGRHAWFIAPSGTAGAVVTYTQAMTLFPTGNLVINTTSDAGFRLDVNGTARVQGTTTISGDNNLIFQRATDGNSLLGIELRGSGGAERGAFKINMSTGELRIGATTGGGFFPTFYTNGVEGGRFTTGGTFQTTASVTAASAIARGVFFNNTLVAAANNDVLVGLDINPTFTNGAFTGVSNIGLRLNSTGFRLDYGATGANTFSAVTTNTFSFTNRTATSQVGTAGSAAWGLWDGTRINGFFGPSGINTHLGFSVGSSHVGTWFTTGNLFVGPTPTDAGFRLDVNGTARVSGQLTANSFVPTSSVVPTIGMYSPATNTLGFATNSTLALSIASTGAATFSSSVTAGAFLTNASSGAAGQEGLRINNDNGYIGFFNGANNTRSGYLQGNTTDVTLTTSPSTPLIFGTANVEKMRITSGGNVGIGTNNPTEKLDVIGGAVAAGNGTIRTGITYSSLGLIGTFTNHDLGVITNGSERMRITSGGLVGIGTSNPSDFATLTLVKNGASVYSAVAIGNSSSTATLFAGVGGNSVSNTALRNNAYLLNVSNSDLILGTNDTERMRITSGGNVEIAIGSIKTGEPDTGYGRAAVKIGARNTGQAFDSGGHLPVNIDGTIYYINLYSSLP